MKAEYTPNLAFTDNPYVEALPPVLSGQTLIDALGNYPPYDESMRQLPVEVRLQMLANLHNIYVPLEKSLLLYYQIYNAIQHSYSQSMMDTVRAYHRTYRDIQNRQTTVSSASTGGGISFSVIGSSGIGKSTAIHRIVSLFPPVIEHQEYQDTPLICKEIPCLTIETPHDGSVKGLCLSILLRVDELVGSNHYSRAVSNRLTADVLVSTVSQVARNSNIGIIILDEIQNISYAKSGGTERFLNHLVQFINNSRVSICLCGTYQILNVLQKQMHSARRSTGFIWKRLADNREFSRLLNSLWGYQYTRNRVPLTPEISNWMYRKTQGVPDVMVKLIYHAQQRAILDGSEAITIETLDKAYKTNLQMVDGFLAALDEAPKSRRAAPKPPAGDLTFKVENGLQEPKNRPQSADLRIIVADAKKQGVAVIDALAEFITEVAI